MSHVGKRHGGQEPRQLAQLLPGRLAKNEELVLLVCYHYNRLTIDG